MPASRSLIKDSRWRKKVVVSLRNAILDMVTPFSLTDLYPTREEKVDDHWEAVKEILPHQQKMHERISLCGREANIIGFSGGVGCIGGETILAGRPIADWVRDHTAPPCLPTLFGSAIPEVPYRKGRDHLYRVRTQSGREVVVTEHHRFLTLSGWEELASLSAGSLIAVDGNWCEPASSEKSTGSQADCWSGLRPYDGLSSPEEVAVLDRWQRFRRTDAENSAWQVYNLLSIGDSCCLSDHALQAVASVRHDASDGDELLRGQRRTLAPERSWTLLLDTAQSTPTWADDDEQSSLLSPQLDRRRFEGFGSRRCKTRPVPHPQLYRFPDAGTLQEPSLVVYPTSSYHQYTSYWDPIASIEYERYDDYYDIGVPGAEHYSAQGIWHHNSGKSLALHVEMVALLRRYPGIRIVTVCPYDYFFDESVNKTRELVLPDDDPLVEDYNIRERRITMKNGSEWRFKAYQDAERIKGWEAHIIWIEEGSELGDGNSQKAISIYRALLMRLRGQGNFPLRMYISQNPKGHNWFWNLFVKDSPYRNNPKVTWITPPATDPEKPEGVCYKEYETVRPNGDIMYCISVPTAVNTKLPPTYLNTMLDQFSNDPQTRLRMIEGDFNPINQLIYDLPYYNPKVNIVEAEDVFAYWELDRAADPWEAFRRWPLYVGIDTGGQQSPWAVEFYARAPDGSLYCCDELYLFKQTWGMVAEKIKDKTFLWSGPIHYYIDPISSRQSAGPNQQRISDEFAEYGIPCQMPEHYNKHSGITHVQSLLIPDREIPHPYLTDDYDEQSGLYAIGAPTLYYLKDAAHREAKILGVEGSKDNPEGWLPYYNLREKEVWRIDMKKQRLQTEAEEGLSPQTYEKPVDRDDHAQTAEMFALLGCYPLETRRHRKNLSSNKPTLPYPGLKRKAW